MTLTSNQKYYRANREAEKARSAAYRATNPEKHKKSTSAWRAANKEHVAATLRAWRKANKNRLKEYRRADYAANRERDLAKGAEYKAKHKAELAAKQSAKIKADPSYNRFARSLRRAAEKKATPSWANRKAILAFYVEAVRLTKETGVLHEVDHIYPLQSKVMCGLHVEANLQILTFAANRSKSNRHWPDAPAEMRI